MQNLVSSEQKPKEDKPHFAVEEVFMLERGKNIEIAGQYLRESFLSNKKNPEIEFEKFLKILVNNNIRYSYYYVSDKWIFYRPLVTENEIIAKWKEGQTPDGNGMYSLQPDYIHFTPKQEDNV